MCKGMADTGILSGDTNGLFAFIEMRRFIQDIADVTALIGRLTGVEGGGLHRHITG